MSHTNRNFVIAYILLVGLPIAGLLGVLKTGRHLAAPVSVDGNWKVRATADAAASSACFQSISWLQDSPLAISQSGPGLVLSWNGVTKPTAPGSLDGNAIKASIPTGSASGACGGGNLTLLATVDPKSEPRSMKGTITVDGCSSCATLDVHGVRQPRSLPKGGH
jgi:hypothetical protein